MYYKDFYKNLSKQQIKSQIENEGFNPHIFKNPPGYIYSQHSHPETKLLAFLEGSMVLKIENEIYSCTPYDKVIIPGNIKHSAEVGPEGCTFFWSEKLIPQNS